MSTETNKSNRTTLKRDLEKRPTKETYLDKRVVPKVRKGRPGRWKHSYMSTETNVDSKRHTKEICEREHQKRPI